MEFRILGPLEVWEAGQAVTLSGAKPRALLAILLIHANRVVAADRLIDLLWDETPSDTVNNTLQVCVSKLRRNLEPGHVHGSPHQVVIGQPPGYLIRVDREQLDLTKFESLVGEARQSMAAGDAEGAATSLRAALGLWRGPAFANLANESFIIAEANRLGEMRLRAIEDRIDAELVLGRHADLVGELEALVTEHPLRERLCQQLMLALYRSGRQAEASEVFYKTRELLVDQAGLEPGPELQRLLKAILNQDPALDLQARVETSRPPKVSNLPLPLTSFVGRADAMSEVNSRLGQSRLLTLTGAGGIGKTRLAIEVARGLLEAYTDGVALVELAPLTDPDLVPQSTAFALGLSDRSGRSLVETLTDYLRPRNLLLVLDNCEHLIDASARLAKVLLESCPELRILATSREALGVDGETAWRVPSLSLPESGQSLAAEDLTRYEAVALFAARARSARSSFTVSDRNAAAVIDICQRLDGIPLALELAAARLTVLTPAQITARLNDRFRLLGNGSRTASPRQQTLRATIDWSYELLPESERALLRRLSVFAGGISLEAAEAICGGTLVGESEVLDRLSRLVRKSFVLVQEVDGVARYQLLETIRQYASEKMLEAGEADGVGNGHEAWFLGMAESAEPELRGKDQLIWLERLKLEHDNLRAALEHSFQREAVEGSLRLVASMAWFWRVTGRLTEGREWLGRALAASEHSSPALRARALAWAAMLAGEQGDYAKAVPLGNESLAANRTIGDPWGAGLALWVLAVVAANRDDYMEADRLLEESRSRFQEAGDIWGTSRSLHWLGNIAWAQADYPRAASRLQEALALARQLGDTRGTGATLQGLGQIELSQGNYEPAAVLLQEALALLEEVGSKEQAAVAVYRLAIVERCRKNYESAMALLERSLPMLRELDDKSGQAYVLSELGVIAGLTGNPDRAASLLRDGLRRAHDLHAQALSAKCLEGLAALSLQQDLLPHAASLFAAADGLRKEIGAPVEPFEREGREEQVRAVQAGLNPAAFAQAWHLGQTMTAQEVVDFALEEAEAAVQVR